MRKTYTIYSNDRDRVIAVASYAGKLVRGVAKCSPNDEFDYDMGSRLAMARCEEKIARKRKANAKKKLVDALMELNKIEAHVEKMEQYWADSCEELIEAEKILREFNENL